MTRRRCFISARYGLDLSSLQRALEANEVEWQWAPNLPIGASFTESISVAINRSDFLLGVLSENPTNFNVAFEVGYALGRGLPVLLLTTDLVSTPFDLAAFRQLNVDLHDQKLLEFQIKLLLSSLEGPKTSRRAKPLKSPASATHQHAPTHLALQSALERDVADSIISAGGRVTVPDTAKGDRGADLLMWLPELDKELFNPAAIEVKGSLNAQTLPAAQRKLDEFVRKSSSGCGLIVANVIASVQERPSLAPFSYVFLLSVAEFKNKLASGILASWVRHERNRLAHGLR